VFSTSNMSYQEFDIRSIVPSYQLGVSPERVLFQIVVDGKLIFPEFLLGSEDHPKALPTVASQYTLPIDPKGIVPLYVFLKSGSPLHSFLIDLESFAQSLHPEEEFHPLVREKNGNITYPLRLSQKANLIWNVRPSELLWRGLRVLPRVSPVAVLKRRDGRWELKLEVFELTIGELIKPTE
jgi:hypothetical protein